LNIVLPRIEDALKTQGYPELSTAVGWNSDWTQMETLDSAVLEAYLERRCDPLVGTIEPSMYLGGLEWDFDIEPTHLKPYAQEILANLIAVHAEVINCYVPNKTRHIYINFEHSFSRAGAQSCASSITTNSIPHNRDYSGRARATHVVRYAVSTGWNYSSSDRYNTLEERFASL